MTSTMNAARGVQDAADALDITEYHLATLGPWPETALLAAHMTEPGPFGHGWVLLDGEDSDLAALNAMHRVAHEGAVEDACRNLAAAQDRAAAAQALVHRSQLGAVRAMCVAAGITATSGPAGERCWHDEVDLYGPAVS